MRAQPRRASRLTPRTRPRHRLLARLRLGGSRGRRRGPRCGGRGLVDLVLHDGSIAQGVLRDMDVERGRGGIGTARERLVVTLDARELDDGLVDASTLPGPKTTSMPFCPRWTNPSTPRAAESWSVFTREGSCVRILKRVMQMSFAVTLSLPPTAARTSSAICCLSTSRPFRRRIASGSPVSSLSTGRFVRLRVYGRSAKQTLIPPSGVADGGKMRWSCVVWGLLLEPQGAASRLGVS